MWLDPIKAFEQLKERNPHFAEIVRFMYEAIGLSPDGQDLNGDWFLKHEWDEKQKGIFHKRAYNYLMCNSEARNSLMRFPKRKKENVKKVIDQIIFQWGWKEQK